MVCLMTGVALTNDMRKELYKTACEMGQKGCEKMAVTLPDGTTVRSSDPEVDEAVLRVLQDVVGLMLNKLADREKEAAKMDADV